MPMIALRIIDPDQNLMNGDNHNGKTPTAKNETIVDWNDALATGVPLLDEQHKALFKCVSEIEWAVQERRVILTIHAIDQLKTYVRSHFATEERLMRSHGYPGLDLHIEEHRRFTAKLFDLIMTNVQRDNSAEMLVFLQNWLIDHVSRSDMDYVPYLLRPPGHPRP
jgi:hemerythrin